MKLESNHLGTIERQERVRKSGKERRGKSAHIMHAPGLLGLHVSDSIKDLTFMLKSHYCVSVSKDQKTITVVSVC